MLESTNKSVPSSKQSSITCNLANNDHGETYYAGVAAKVDASEERCITECHSKCQICWTDDECQPICSEDKKFAVDGFKLQEMDCQRPYYFCSRGLTKYKYKGNNGETRIRHFVGMNKLVL